MTKPFVRWIAVVLVPTLLINPVFATGLTAPLPPSSVSSAASQYFARQVVNPVPLWTGVANVFRRFTATARSQSFDQAEALGLWEQNAGMGDRQFVEIPGVPGLEVESEVLQTYGQSLLGKDRDWDVLRLIALLADRHTDSALELLKERRKYLRGVATGNLEPYWPAADKQIPMGDGTTRTVGEIFEKRTAVKRIPADLARRGVTLTGPIVKISMLIGGINADVAHYLMDWEDALADVDDNIFKAMLNLTDVLNGRVTEYTDSKSGKVYKITKPREEWPTMEPRYPGLHLWSLHFKYRGRAVPASIPVNAMYALNNYEALRKENLGIRFYSPKKETWQEARWFVTLNRDSAIFLEQELRRRGSPYTVKPGDFRLFNLNENAKYSMQMPVIQEVEWPNYAGSSVGRWDYQASLLKIFQFKYGPLLGDLFRVKMSEPPMSGYVEGSFSNDREVGGVPVGGMFAGLESNETIPGTKVLTPEALSANDLVLRESGEDTRFEAELGAVTNWIMTTAPNLVAARNAPFNDGNLKVKDLPLVRHDRESFDRIFQFPVHPVNTNLGAYMELYFATHYVIDQQRKNQAVAIKHATKGYRFMNDFATFEGNWVKLWLRVHHQVDMTAEDENNLPPMLKDWIQKIPLPGGRAQMTPKLFKEFVQTEADRVKETLYENNDDAYKASEWPIVFEITERLVLHPVIIDYGAPILIAILNEKNPVIQRRLIDNFFRSADSYAKITHERAHLDAAQRFGLPVTSVEFEGRHPSLILNANHPMERGREEALSDGYVGRPGLLKYTYGHFRTVLAGPWASLRGAIAASWYRLGRSYFDYYSDSAAYHWALFTGSFRGTVAWTGAVTDLGHLVQDTVIILRILRMHWLFRLFFSWVNIPEYSNLIPATMFPSAQKQDSQVSVSLPPNRPDDLLWIRAGTVGEVLKELYLDDNADGLVWKDNAGIFQLEDDIVMAVEDQRTGTHQEYGDSDPLWLSDMIPEASRGAKVQIVIPNALDSKSGNRTTQYVDVRARNVWEALRAVPDLPTHVKVALSRNLKIEMLDRNDFGRTDLKDGDELTIMPTIGGGHDGATAPAPLPNGKTHQIRIPPTYLKFSGQREMVEAHGDTVRAVLIDLAKSVPELQDLLFTEDGRVRVGMTSWDSLVDEKNYDSPLFDGAVLGILAPATDANRPARVIFNLPKAVGQLTKKQTRVVLSADTVFDAVARLEQMFPGLSLRIQLYRLPIPHSNKIISPEQWSHEKLHDGSQLELGLPDADRRDAGAFASLAPTEGFIRTLGNVYHELGHVIVGAALGVWTKITDVKRNPETQVTGGIGNPGRARLIAINLAGIIPVVPGFITALSFVVIRQGTTFAYHQTGTPGAMAVLLSSVTLWFILVFLPTSLNMWANFRSRNQLQSDYSKIRHLFSRRWPAGSPVGKQAFASIDQWYGLLHRQKAVKDEISALETYVNLKASPVGGYWYALDEYQTRNMQGRIKELQKHLEDINRQVEESERKMRPYPYSMFSLSGGHDGENDPITHALDQIPNQAVRDFVADARNLANPDAIELVDASDDQRLLEEAVAAGEGFRTANGNFYFRSHPKDTARSVERTFVSTSDPHDKGRFNNWQDSKDLKPVVTETIRGSVKGKKMYVIPYLMGPTNSPFHQIGVQVTDSRYVAINMIRMAKVGKVAWDALKHSDHFVKGIHSTGDLDTIRRAKDPKNDPDDRYFASFPEERLILSYGSGYGGNALLGKKFHALRQASYDARSEGWLAEHMLIAGIEDLEAPEVSKDRIRYIAAAFPSASGKTNLAMLMPPEALGKRYKVWVVGDDIAWLHKGTDGRLHAFNPENGMFGVVPETNGKTNPNAMVGIGPHTGTIYTNVAFNPKTGEIWWEGKGSKPSLEGDGANWLDWKGERIMDRPESAKNDPWAHPNSRYTTALQNTPNWIGHAKHLADDFNDPAGVPISAIFWGGRVSSSREPLIRQLGSTEDGIYDGALMGVEKTAAAEGKVGEFTEDPMAQLPFFAYNETEYFSHFHRLINGLGNKAPGFFHVNWFQKDADGKYRWPGYSENLRAILWALDRVGGKSEATVTPAGFIPTANALNREGLPVLRDVLEKLLGFDIAAWKEEAARRSAYVQEYWSSLPKWFIETHLTFLRRLIRLTDLPASAFPKNPEVLKQQKAEAAIRKAMFDNEVTQLENEWANEDPFWKRERSYKAKDVVRLRNSAHLREDHSWAKNTATKLRAWIKEAYQKKEGLVYFGVMSGQEAVDAVRAAHKAGKKPVLYLSGWNTAASGNTNRRNFPDLALFDADSLVQIILDIKHALQQAEQLDRIEGNFDIDWAAPIVVDIETGRGIVNETYLLAKRVLEAGAAAVHIENQYIKKCGHMSFMTLVATIIQIKRIMAAHLAADVLGIPAIVITRSDTMRAELIQDNIDPIDRPFLAWHKIRVGDNLNGEIVEEKFGRLSTKSIGYLHVSDITDQSVLNGQALIREETDGKKGPLHMEDGRRVFSKEKASRDNALLMADGTLRVEEGLYFFDGGRAAAIAHGRVMARFGHVSWFETGSPSRDEAVAIARGIHQDFPDQPMKYNLSGNFDYSHHTDDELMVFDATLPENGYVLPFNTIIQWWNRRAGAIRFSSRFFLGSPTLALKQAQEEAQAAAALLDTKIRPQRDVGSPIYDFIGETLGLDAGAANAVGESTEWQFHGQKDAGTHSVLANLFTGPGAPINWIVRILFVGAIIPHELGHFVHALAAGRWDDIQKVRISNFIEGRMPFEVWGRGALAGMAGNLLVVGTSIGIMAHSGFHWILAYTLLANYIAIVPELLATMMTRPGDAPTDIMRSWQSQPVLQAA